MELTTKSDVSVHFRSPWEHLKAYLGLSEYEARVYDFLVNKGPSTAREISIKCGIPRTKIYCVLKRLREQCIIAEVPLKPRLFTALPPSEVIRPLIEIREKIIRDLHEVFLNLQRRYEESAKFNIVREEAWVLTGNNSLKKVLDLLSSAERLVELFSPWEIFLQIYEFLRKTLDCLLEKGIDILLYASSNSNIDKKMYCRIGLRCRVVSNLPSAIIISIDDKYIILHSFEDENNIFLDGEWIIIHDKKLLSFFNKILSFLKEKLCPYQKIILSENSQKFLF